MKLTSRGPGFYLFLPLFLIFFALPYLFDIVFCEDLYATQLSQAALIDAEIVDPHTGDVPSTALDCTPTGASSVDARSVFFAIASPFDCSSIGPPIPILLVSRPPPAS